MGRLSEIWVTEVRAAYDHLMDSLLNVVGVIAFAVIVAAVARHALWAYRQDRNRQRPPERSGFCIELPYGTDESMTKFARLLTKIAPLVVTDSAQRKHGAGSVDFDVLISYPEHTKPGDLPVVLFIVRCDTSQLVKLKKIIKNVYREANLVPLPRTAIEEGIEAWRAEHYPPERQAEAV